jgi:hypothetical protein
VLLHVLWTPCHTVFWQIRDSFPMSAHVGDGIVLQARQKRVAIRGS